jgi:pentatricopeptide repeat protein
VLDEVWVSPDELAYVVRTVGAASWRRALDAFEWLVASGTVGPGPRVIAVVLGRTRQEVFLRFMGEGAIVQVFNAIMGVYGRFGRFEDVRQLLDAMRGQEIETNLVSFNTLINARSKSGSLGRRHEQY